MSLFSVHKILIAIAILFFTGFAVRDVASGDGSASMASRSAASVAGAIVLALYLRWLVRRQGRAPRAAALRSERRRDKEVQP